jgi:hypothetical protein
MKNISNFDEELLSKLALENRKLKQQIRKKRALKKDLDRKYGDNRKVMDEISS